MTDREAEKSPEQLPTRIPEFEAHLGGESIKFTGIDTTIFTFNQPYAELDHVFKLTEEPNTGTYFFNAEDLIHHLMNLGFPSRHDLAPPKCDVDAYMRFEHNVLERDLRSLDGEV